MEGTFGTRDIVAALFRNLRIFSAVVAGCVLLGILTILFSVPLYLTSGSLLVKFGSDADARVNNPNDKVQISTIDRREIMQSNLDILQSHDLLKMVIEKVGVDRIYPGLSESIGTNDSPVEVAVRNMQRKHLVIKSSQQSNVIDIILLNQDPEVSAEIVRELQSIFIARQLEIFNKPQTNFLLEQVKESESKLNKAQKDLRDFKSSVGISSIEEELNELLKQKSNAATVAYQAVDDSQNKLSELRDKEIELLTTYRPHSPPIISIKKSIAEAERQLRERQNNLTASRNSTLSEQNASINRRINKLEEQRNHYNDLIRQVEVEEVNYKNYLARSEEARINETLGEKKITSISVVDTPDVPVRPAIPRKKLILLSSIIAGILLGAVVVFIREFFDESFRTPKQLSKDLGIPVLTSLPRQDGLIQLFNNIEHLLVNVPQPVIQFVSSYEGEGAGAVAKELADLAAKQGKNVLLIDSEQLHKNFSQEHFDFTKRHNNSWTIIASSALLRNELGQSLAKQANGSVLVVEAERTRAPVAKEVKRMIEALGGKVVGSVLVKRQMYIPGLVYDLLYKTEK
ncbi:MAG: GNVR domain-containing protein [Rickettsiales bacterium]